jgi:dTDP-glucose 4,6-dehydratase
LPVYGTGGNLRDWIHVDDHNRGVIRALEKGRAGEVYHIGARCERSNLELIRSVARCAAEVLGRAPEDADASIEFVEDRQGHDARRSLDPAKAERELGFKAEVDFEVGLRETVKWILGGRE